MKQASIIHNMRRLYTTNNGLTSVDRLLRMKPILAKKPSEGKDGVPEIEDFDSPHIKDPSVKVGKKLLKLGKVYYKHIEPIPVWIKEKISDISQNRSRAQVRRCLQKWMIAYNREDQTNFKNRKLGWRNAVPDNLRKVISYGPEETIAYAQYFFPSRYAITKRILNDVNLVLPSFRPLRILDFGCGLGTGFAAAKDVFNKEQTIINKYVGIDISQAMLGAAKVMTSGERVNCIFYDKIAEVVELAQSKNERFDLILCTFTLSEFVADPSRKAAVQLLFELLDEGGVIVFVENGNPEGSHTVRTTRQFLINYFNHGIDETQPMSVEEMELAKNDKSKTNLRYVLPPPFEKEIISHKDYQATVIAPCSHEKNCPLGQGIWCSFAQKVHSGMIRKESLEKFSYVVIQKTKKLSNIKVEQTKLNTAIKNVPSYPIKRNNPSLIQVPSIQNKNKENKDIKYEDKRVFKYDNWVVPNFNFNESFSVLNILQQYMSLNNKSISYKYEDEEDDEDDYDDDDEDDDDFDEKEIIDGNEIFIENEELEKDYDPIADEDDFENNSIEDNADNIYKKSRVASNFTDTLSGKIDWPNYSPPLHREEWTRILRSPIKGKGHITLDLCHPEGNIIRQVIGKSKVKHVPFLFSALRKSSWGGLFPSIQNIGKVELNNELNDDDSNGRNNKKTSIGSNVQSMLTTADRRSEKIIKQKKSQINQQNETNDDGSDDDEDEFDYTLSEKYLKNDFEDEKKYQGIENGKNIRFIEKENNLNDVLQKTTRRKKVVKSKTSKQ